MNSYKNQYRFIDNVCYIDCFNTKGVLTGSILLKKLLKLEGREKLLILVNLDI